jgi:vacuolar-type H+-ATPase subunit E/Vma4
MNDTDKLLQALAALQEGQKALIDKVAGLEAGQHSLAKRMEGVGSVVSRTSTAVKALPTKEDMEVAIDAAKSELKAEIMTLNAKVVREVQSVKRRVTNIEDQAGIENPERH